MMDKVVFAQYTVQDLFVAAGFVVGIFIVLVILKQIFGGKKQSRHIQTVECTGCGWQGQVSRYTGRCPVCNSPLGEQKAEPKR
jgi:predicted Zn-ribbon and HTH transcriptional regulator